MDARAKHMESPVGPRARINGRDVDYFCGTSYFGLHAHPVVIDAACAAARAYGIGPATGASTPPLAALLDEARRFFGVDAVACVASGYLAPAALVQALRDDVDVAFADEASHYSLLDALRATGKDLVLFRHLDPGDLAQALSLHVRPGIRPLVMTDGVFPSTGAVPPLSEYAAILDRYPQAVLCADDAHAFGVIGESGRGSLEYHGIDRARTYSCGTLSKAFGGSGGIVPCDASLAAKIRDKAYVAIGASAAPTPALAAAAAGMYLLAEHPEMRRALWDNVRRARGGLRSLGFALADSPIPIVCLRGSRSLDLERVAHDLDRADIVVHHVAPHGYSDAPDVESLRIAISSGHTYEQIDRLIDGVRRAL